MPQTEVMTALRADQWLENHPDAGDPQRGEIKRQVRDAFYTDTDEWKQRIVEQGVDAAWGAVRGLGIGGGRRARPARGRRRPASTAGSTAAIAARASRPR